MSERFRPKALLLFPESYLPEELSDRLSSLVEPCWVRQGVADVGPDMAAGVEIIVTGPQDEFSQVILEQFSRLKLILATSTSFDFIDRSYCKDFRITVCNTPGYTGAAVAEYSFALLLDRARHLTAVSSRVQEGKMEFEQYLGMELEGKCAGIVSVGDIGERIARLAQGFGMSVVYTSRHWRDVGNARKVELRELLALADVMFLAVPLTEETSEMIDSEALGSMKRTSILINISAEGVVSGRDLKNALTQGTIAGAALDIPKPNEEYWRTERLIVTPGCGWYTKEAVHRRADTWIETLSLFLENHPRNVVPASD